MNWDKQSIAAVVIGALVLIGWFMYGPKMTAPQTTAQNTTEQFSDGKAQSATPTTETPAPAPAAEKAAAPAPQQTAAIQAVTISAGGSTYAIQPAFGTVEKITLPGKFNKNASSDAIELTSTFPQAEYNPFGIRPEGTVFLCEKILESKKINDAEYLLSRQMRDGFGNQFIIESYYKAVGEYRMQTVIRFKNTSGKAIQMPGILVSAGDLQPWYQLSGDKRSNSQETMTVEYCTESGKTKYENAVADDDDWAELQNKTVRWAGSTNRFFAQLLKSAEAAQLHCDRKNSPEGSKEFAVNTNAKFKPFILEPNAVKELNFDYYMGPKYPKNLSAFDSEAVEVMHLGWFPIDFLAHIMLKIMNFIQSFIGSFGLSIILLTLLVRLIFFPVTMKANDSMRAMQVLAPKLKEIREKYKDEPMLAQTKMSELYKEHKVNPLGGCLPMLIQIPVFIALYYALGGAAELRGQSFLWIKDLAQPDTVATIFGLNINPLIIAWTGLMVVQQKLTPTSMDPMQAKVMLAMPLVMLFILYTLPAALTLYWTVSQIFSILQMIYQNKRRKKNDANGSQDQGKPASKPKTVRS